MTVQIDLSSLPRQKGGLASVRLNGGSGEFALDLPFDALFSRFGRPDLTTLDLLVVASICYLTDKAVPRSKAPDGWTRDLELEIPVSDPARWAGVALDLSSALTFLTGDEWRLSFCGLGGIQLLRPPMGRLFLRRRPPAPESVCLFSGGMDSLLGAIDLLAATPARVLLVGHFDSPGPKSQQKALFSEIDRRYPNRCELLSTRVAHRPAAALELTLRSRSFLFIALAIYCAKAAGDQVPVVAPENGPIAINVPLTPARAGSCSTRTMHPFFLEKVSRILLGLGIRNTISNPFELKTKGECLEQCAGRPIAEGLVPLSVSCSHGTRRKDWLRRTGFNCGYCVPCLFRRAALNKCGLDDGRAYGIDVCGELAIDGQGDIPDDFRAALDWLRGRRTKEYIARAIFGVAPVPRLVDHADVVWRGLEELRALLLEKGSEKVKRAIGDGDA